MFKKHIFYLFPALFCFLLPFGGLYLSAIIILWGVASFLNINKNDFINGIKQTPLLLIWLFALYTFLSALLFGGEDQEVNHAIETKLSFIFLPYLIFCFNYPNAIIKRCFVSFVSGCFFASLLLIIRAVYFAANGAPEYFFYTKFSWFIHASYFSMYLCFAGVLIVAYYFKWFNKNKSIIYFSYALLLIFTVSIFFCSSKMGIITWLIISTLLLFKQYKTKLSLQKTALLLFTLILVLISIYILFPKSFERFTSITHLNTASIDKTSAESTTVRFLIWEQALTLIKKNLLFGVGVGKTNASLYEMYSNNGLSGAFEHKLNSHNQFLQTFIGLGIVGFIILFYLTAYQLLKAIKKQQFVLLLFSVLIFCNFLVESMLETSAGVLFFTFFYSMFNSQNESKLYESTH
ncbi:MAG: O-antigen ligase family protein [Bacteroidetes bacterium]|nr:O-antigen ligase family protein [Bacteroidota bacterium]